MNWTEEEFYQSILTGKYKIRNTEEEKQDFITLLKQKFDLIKIEYFTSFSLKFLRVKGENVILGDIYNADVILTAHYDTPLVPSYDCKHSSIHYRNFMKNSIFYRILFVFFVPFFFVNDSFVAFMSNFSELAASV